MPIEPLVLAFAVLVFSSFVAIRGAIQAWTGKS